MTKHVRRGEGEWTVEEAAAYLSAHDPSGPWTVERVRQRIRPRRHNVPGHICSAERQPIPVSQVQFVTRSSVMRYARLLQGHET